MANAFYWEYSVFPMAIAPWHHDWTQQQVVNARVTVAEQRTPSFALRFDLELPRTEASTCERHLMRLVNQQQMRRAFEFAFVGEKAVGRRPPGGDGNSKLLDQRLKNWLTGCEQAQGPPKEELSKWLLSWMMLTERKGDDGDGENPQEWLVLLCGEEGVEDVWEEETLSDVYHESSDTSESFMGGEKLSDEYCWDENSGDDEDLPPPYDKIKDAEANLSIQDGHCDNVGKTQSTRSLIQGTSIRSRSLVSSHSAEVIPKPKLQPTIVSLEIRHGALDREYPEEEEFTAEWATDQRHLPRDFCASRRAVQVAKRQYDQTIKVAQVRHTEMLRETAKKAVEMEQTRRDAQVLRQLNADTLEYRKELNRIEAQMKQTSIAARREQQRAKRKMRGIWHGTDTMEPIERFVTKERERSRRDGRAVHVYDLNGRRQEQDVERSSTLSSSSAGSERRKNDRRERESTTTKLGRQRIWMEVEAVKAAQERLYRFFQKDENSL